MSGLVRVYGAAADGGPQDVPCSHGGDGVSVRLGIADGRQVEVVLRADGSVRLCGYPSQPDAIGRTAVVEVAFTMPTLEDAVLDLHQPIVSTVITRGLTKDDLASEEQDPGIWARVKEPVRQRLAGIRTLLALNAGA